MKVDNWDQEIHGQLTMQILRSLYQPAHHFRIYQNRYQPHTPFGSAGVAQTYYVLSGQMWINDGAQTYTIGENQYIALPAGRYTITYPEIVEHIKVLELPEQAWESEKQRYVSTVPLISPAHDKPG